MAIDKALDELPQGLAAIPEAPPIEIEIEDPESVKINMDGLEIDIEKAEDSEEFNKNLAEELTEGELTLLAGDLFYILIRSRGDVISESYFSTFWTNYSFESTI